MVDLIKGARKINKMLQEVYLWGKTTKLGYFFFSNFTK